MKVAELKKGTAEIKRGLVMMFIEGEATRCEEISAHMNTEYGYKDTNCADEGEKEGDLAIYFIINRDDVSHFRACFQKAKKAVK